MSSRITEADHSDRKWVASLSKSLKTYLDAVTAFLGIMVLVCIVLSQYFTPQIIQTFGSQVSTTTTQMSSAVLTSTTTASAMSCTTNPCTITEAVSQGMIIAIHITGTTSHMIPTIQQHATKNLQFFLDVLAGLFAIVFAYRLVFRRKLRRKQA